MTADKLYTVFCNGPKCGEWDDAGVGATAKEAREQLARLGWQLRVKDPNNPRRLLDFCPLHTATDPADAE